MEHDGPRVDRAKADEKLITDWMLKNSGTDDKTSTSEETLTPILSIYEQKKRRIRAEL